MTTVTLTPELLKQLNGLNGPLEFRDSQGRLVATYCPVDVEEPYVNPIDGSHFTEDQLRQMADIPIEQLAGRPLEEILRELESPQ